MLPDTKANFFFRFTIKAPDIERRDAKLQHVIISEAKDIAASKHQVIIYKIVMVNLTIPQF